MSLKLRKSSTSLSKSSKLPSPLSLTGVDLRDFMNPVIPDTV